MLTKIPINNILRKKWFKVISRTLIILILIPVILYGVLRTTAVQTWLSARLTHYLSKELNAHIFVKGVDVSWFLDLKLDQVYISDQHKDTLLYAKALIVDVNRLHYNSRILKINSINLIDATVNLKKYPEDSVFNYQFLLDYFSTTDTTTQPDQKKWKISVNGINLINSKLQYSDATIPPVQKGIDYNHIVLGQVNLRSSGLKIIADTVRMHIDQLSFLEKSGFSLKKMNCRLKIDPLQIQLKDLVVRTGFSNIETDLTFSYPDFSAFGDFLDQVTLSAYFLPSDIDFKDLGYIVPDLEGMNERIVLEGQVDGKINNLRMKDIHLDYGSFTRFKGNIKVSGLPDIEETFIQLNIRELTTNHYDLSTFTLPGGSRLEIPGQLVQMGNINIKGIFTGFYNDFVSYAHFKTDLGSVFTDLSYKDNRETGNIEYSGKITTKELNLGVLTGQQEYIGKINLTANITGSGTTLDDLILNIDGVVDSLYFKGNTFSQLTIAGGIMDRRFSGNMNIKDQRLGLDFDGFVDFKKEHPVFDFITNIHHAWLNQLNLVKSDSIMGLKTSMKIHFEGIDPDSITGQIVIDSTRFRMNHSVYLMNHLALNVKRQEDNRKNITLSSDYADIKVIGAFRWEQLIPSFREWVYYYFPSLAGTEKYTFNDPQPDLTFSVNLKDTRPFSRMFLPSVTLAPNTSLSGIYQPAAHRVGLQANSPLLNLYGTGMINWSLQGNSDSNDIKLSTTCDHIDFTDELGLDNFQFSTVSKQDSVKYDIRWKNENLLIKNQGDIGGYLHVQDSGVYRFHLNRSSTTINDSVWSIPDLNIVEIDTESVKIKNLEFISGDEKIAVSGSVSKNPLDLLNVNFQGFDLSNVNFFTDPVGFNFKGLINGKIEMMNLLNAPNLASDIVINGFTVNNDKLGNMAINSRWDQALQALFAKAEVIYKGNIGENRPLSMEGYYYPMKKDECLDFKFHIENFKLKTIANFLSSFSSKFTGYASGDLTLKGNFIKPDLEGKVKVQRGEIRIDYLKTEYSFSQEFELGKNFIGFNNIIAYDSLGNKVFVNGRINHNYFYDFSVDLNIKPQNCLVMNTQSYDNDLFYGKAFGTGEVKIYGPVDNIKIDILAKADKGTQINLPINTTADISDNEFITFGSTQEDTSKVIVTKPPDFTGVSMNLDLEATPDGVVRIFMPDNMGTIKATGKGKIKVGVNTLGQFDIYGDYQIDEGSFLFTLQNVINRLFVVQPGGRIMFSGDPYATTVNLRAIYKLDVPLTGLRVGSNQDSINLSKKIPLDCIIELKGNIFNPDLNFKMATQEKDPELNRIIFTQLDTNNQQQMSEQMIFLLVLKQFKPLERSNALDLNASVGSTSWDILSNQLNSWLSQISKDFDIGVNYKPGDKLTSDELTVALSTQLFNDRVLIDGNFGYNSKLKGPAASTQNASNLVGDVKVEVKLTDDGRFRVKAYNKSNNVAMFENNAPYTQGVGIFFRKEFDNFRELFRGRKKKTVISSKEAIKPEEQ